MANMSYRLARAGMYGMALPIAGGALYSLYNAKLQEFKNKDYDQAAKSLTGRFKNTANRINAEYVPQWSGYMQHGLDAAQKALHAKNKDESVKYLAQMDANKLTAQDLRREQLAKANEAFVNYKRSLEHSEANRKTMNDEYIKKRMLGGGIMLGGMGGLYVLSNLASKYKVR